jgi:hypothetical protein
MLCLLFSTLTQADTTTFLVRPPASEKDARYHYELEALSLALSKTESEYGAFRVSYSPPMNNLRAVDYIRNNRLPNFFAYMGFEAHEDDSNIVLIPFPVHLGVVGYRVCFGSEPVIKRIKNIQTVEDLKPFSFAMGRGWGDVNVFKHNGLKVIESASYQSLFTRTVAGRIDLFCRGIHEFHHEMQNFAKIIPLTLEPDLLLYYPFPRFLYTHPSNHRNSERILIGLKQAYEDGSLKAVWEEHFRESITAAKVSRRTLISLTNPQLGSGNLDYLQYMFSPDELMASDITE